MPSYMILERSNVPEVLKNKPRWMACAIVVMTALAITMSAVSAGAFIGYTYCYLEHRHDLATGNLSQSTNLQIVHMPFLAKTEETKKNNTINSAISSVLISRILKVGHTLLDEEMPTLPWSTDGPDEIRPIFWL